MPLQKKKIKHKYNNNKTYRKFKAYCHYTGKYRSVQKYSIPKELPVNFQNRSNYDYHFVIKVWRRI